MSEWDPWRRYWKEQERRMWDPWARLEYQRERESWDPFYRLEKHLDRMSWDPYYRTEKMIEKRYSDSEYRWRLYEEKRDSGEWYEAYLENPMDPVLKQRYKMLFERDSRVDENTARTLDLFEAMSSLNKMYDRGVGFWLRLMLNLGAIGFLLWLSLSLMFWRPFP